MAAHFTKEKSLGEDYKMNNGYICKPMRTCPKCKRDWGWLFYSAKITGIYRTEHMCKMCGYEWITS